MSYVIDTRYKINHMPEKENTILGVCHNKKDQSAYAINVKKVKKPDLVLVNIDREYR
jgi:hypothetical protein